VNPSPPILPSPAGERLAPPRALAGGLTLAPVELALLVVLLPLATMAWMGLLSAVAGRLAPGLAVAAGGLVLVAIGGLLVRAARGRRWWRTRIGGSAVWWSLGAILIALLAVGRLAPAANPWPAFLDASWYLNTGARIARDGGLTSRPAALAVPPAARPALVATFSDQQAAGLDVPADPRQGLFDVLFAVPRVGEPVVVPYHPPLFAAWVALWARVRDPQRAGNAVLPWALCYLLATGALAQAAFGPVAAALAVSFLAVGPAFIYYGATPYAETAAGALLLTGYWALTRLGAPGSGAPWALLAGLALGSAMVMKVDVIPAVVVALGWWVVVRRPAAGRPEALALAAGLAPPLVGGMFLALTVSRLYVGLNGGGVLRLGLRAAPWVLAVAVLVLALWAALRPHRRLPGGPPLRQAIGLGVLLALGLATLAAVRVPAGQPPAMVSILAWLVTPLGLWAAAGGLVLALREEERPGPLVAAALVALPALLAAPVITRTLSSLYTARRLVPLAVPAVAVLSSGAAVLVARQEPPERWRPVAVTAGALLVLAGLASAAAPLTVRELSGGAVIAERLARHGGPRDVWLFGSVLDGAQPGRLAAALWTLEGRPTAVIGSPEPEPAALAAALDAWRGQGRRVVFVTDPAHPPPAVPGYEAAFLGEESLVTQALATSPELPPRFAPLALQFQIYELLPEGDSG
jgi:hypothetical protein